MAEKLTIAIAQLAPVWLHKAATLQKVQQSMQEAAAKGAQLVVYGEALVPGYPFWVEKTDGAVFDSAMQKDFYAHYVREAVAIVRGELNQLSDLAGKLKLAVYLGVIEKAQDRGDSLYCSLVYINQNGEIASVHRKLVPTYEERLVWSQGDGHGLVTHSLPPFTVGGLNCWENWLPLARTSLYAQGEDLHVSVWPGNYRNTHDLIPMIAKEGRSFVVAACGLFGESQLTDDLPHAALLKKKMNGALANGGSCVAAPDGSWLLEPVVDQEGVFVVELNHEQVRRERLLMNGVGHYSRPDVFELRLNTDRQTLLNDKH
ncbi:carbon-nitrogen hydrolase family protein [Marinoscillum furvescens]|uniref:Nitrilase n=1 Tax=Marinoscillum furvescens DSM 4134 TaxID=1122208 RepID=A0A3D9LGZ6_MARFU|nr:carbon-nitrogen hydrolase family protein [Marinoscillum furvescens]REE05671.1 nitrilase [Marinoscillum furvescens DSM 4134]